ncbi:MAG: hypothetical protein H6Q30_3005 [Bacteroidetes bacterium]|jgi:hypothetical protein|nr:hypothetical protein [Bacteroidota bacterium]
MIRRERWIINRHVEDNLLNVDNLLKGNLPDSLLILFCGLTILRQ